MQKIILFVFFCMVFILLEGRFLRMPMRGRPMPRRPPRPSTRLSNHHIDSPFRMRGENFIARLKANPQQTITTIASTGAGLAALIDLLLELFGNEETTDLMDQFFPIILTTKRHEMSIPKSDFYEEAIFEKMEILMEKKIDEFCFLAPSAPDCSSANVLIRDINESPNVIFFLKESTLNKLLGNDKYNPIYYKIMAKYEMREYELIRNQQTIANDFKLDDAQMNELFKFYEFSKNSLARRITNGMGTKEYLDKFITFANLLNAAEEIENDKIFEENVRGRRLPFRTYTKYQKNKPSIQYIGYELTVSRWNEEYRLRGKIVLGKAVGTIVELDKGSKRIVAMFDKKDEEPKGLTTQADTCGSDTCGRNGLASILQRLSPQYNDNSYRISLLTIMQIKNQNGMKFALFPNAEKLVAYNHFMKKRNEDWGKFKMNLGGSNFNEKQSEAIYSIVNGSHGNVPFILWGPPGTGKTVTIIEAIRQLLMSSSGNRILLCTPSNSAADLVAKKILHDRIVPESELRRYYALGKLVLERDRQLDRIICMVNDDFLGTPMMKFEICGLEESRIVIMTLSASAVLEDSSIGRDFFSHIFIDEAAQALEFDTLIPIARYASEKTRIVLAGDHKQLGPVVTTFFLKRQFCGSLINRLITSFKNTVYRDGRTTVKLIQNYRSHEAILKFPSENFYNGQLIAANTAKRSSFTIWEELPRKGFPIILHILEDGQEQQEGNSNSYWNQLELQTVMHYVQSLMNGRGQRGVPADLTYEQIGVISPYKL